MMSEVIRVLTFVGLGLYDEKDITVKGLEAVKAADILFMEEYTSNLMGTNIKKLETFYRKKIELLTRKEIEEKNIIIKNAEKKNVAFLVPGDSLLATTHHAIYIEALENGIKTRIIHGVSIFVAAPALSGLQAYKFGRTVTIPYSDNDYLPFSPYEQIINNFNSGLHTLVLFDIKAAENRYMSVGEASENILLMREKLIKSGYAVHKTPIDDKTQVIGIARAGSDDFTIKIDSLKNMVNASMGPPLHCMVIPSKLHFIEEEALEIIKKYMCK